MIWFYLTLYLGIGVLVARKSTQNKYDEYRIDMSDVAFIPLIFWPFFLLAWGIGAICGPNKEVR